MKSLTSPCRLVVKSSRCGCYYSEKPEVRILPGTLFAFSLWCSPPLEPTFTLNHKVYNGQATSNGIIKCVFEGDIKIGYNELIINLLRPDMYRSRTESIPTPRGNGRREAVGIVRLVDDPNLVDAHLIRRRHSCQTVDVDCGHGVDVENLGLTGSRCNAGLVVILL